MLVRMTLPSDYMTRLANALTGIGYDEVKPDETGGIDGRWADPPATVYMSVRSFEPTVVGSASTLLIQLGAAPQE